jgi:hypothetical protein
MYRGTVTSLIIILISTATGICPAFEVQSWVFPFDQAKKTLIEFTPCEHPSHRVLFGFDSSHCRVFSRVFTDPDHTETLRHRVMIATRAKYAKQTISASTIHLARILPMSTTPEERYQVRFPQFLGYLSITLSQLSFGLQPSLHALPI